MRIFQYVIIILVILLLSACESILFPPLEVVSVSVPEGAGNDSVSILFSADVDSASISKALTVTEDGVGMKGTVTISGSSVVFTPIKGFVLNKDYEVLVTTDAEDTKGNSLSAEYHKRFSTRSEHTAPAVVSITPSNDSSLSVSPEAIDIVFSEPVDVPSFVRAFSIEPFFPFVHTFTGDDTHVRIVPQELLKIGQRYTITVSTSLLDRAGNALPEAFVSTFLNGTDLTPPIYKLLAVTGTAPERELSDTINNAAIPPDVELLLRFDEPIGNTSINSFISIMPPVSMKLTINEEHMNSVSFDPRARTALIQFTSRLTWGETYELTIRNGITDRANNKITGDKVYKIICNDEAKRPVTIVKAYFDRLKPSADRYFPLDPNTPYSTLFLPVDPGFFELGKTPPPQTEIYFIMNVSSDTAVTEISLVSAMEAIRISLRATHTEMAIKRVENINIASLPVSAPPASSGKNIALKVVVDVTNQADPGFVTFSVSDKLTDNSHNPLISPWEVVCNIDP
ncbi:hypothetical protein AGMMS50268_25770 [Spirochaetia bacterium]|nr:hypothetical protein AGMMS50268_25770 [Spirochaetia bacterium]